MVLACTYEDRPSHAVGLKLLVLSLGVHCPGLTLDIFLGSQMQAIRPWLAGHSHVRVFAWPPTDSSPSSSAVVADAFCPTGWSVKPWIILNRLNSLSASSGLEKAVLWLDADLILTADIRRFLPSNPDAFLAAQEPLYSLAHGSDLRTRALGLQVGRVISRTLNSCCIYAGLAHLSLLKAWAQATQRADYLHWQTVPESQRPVAFLGDQELLNGLLGSADFSHIPLVELRTGIHIAHCVGARGYRPSERLRNLGRGLPPLVHAMGPKPWLAQRNLFAQWSAYCWAARPYQFQLDESASWIYPNQFSAKMIRWLMLDNANLVGLPMSVLGALRARYAKA